MSAQTSVFDAEEAKRSKRTANIGEIVGDGLDVKGFAENFELLAEAMGGLACVRRLVLQLALRGRLSAENAATLPALDELPSGWRRMRLNKAADWASGSGFPKAAQGHSDRPFLFCKVSDMNLPGNERFIERTTHTIDETTAKAIRAKLHPAGTVVFPKIGGAIATNKRRILRQPGAIDNNCLGLTPNGQCSSDYLLLFMQSIDLTAYQNDGPVPALNQGRIGAIDVPVPPLAEQNRIVAKVDQLMALCDELEARQTKKRETGARLTTSALEALTTAEGPEEFDAAWKRVVDNFDLLSNGADQVEGLRSAVLELAATARLVRPAAGSAAEARVLVAGEKGGSRPLRERCGSPGEWKEERGWLRVPLGAILVEPLANGRSVPDDPSGFPVLRLSALRGRYIDFSERKLGAWTEADAAPFVVRKGDVLFVRGNGAIRLVGRACMVGDTPERVAFPDTAIRARVRADVFDAKWLWYVWESRYVRRQVEAAAKTTAGIFKVSQDVLYAVEVPVPTIAEQRRIVALLEHLMKICDDLEARLQRAEDRAAKLVEAVVQELVA